MLGTPNSTTSPSSSSLSPSSSNIQHALDTLSLNEEEPQVPSFLLPLQLTKEKEANFGYLYIPELPSKMDLTTFTSLSKLPPLSLSILSNKESKAILVDPTLNPQLSLYHTLIEPLVTQPKEPFLPSFSSPVVAHVVEKKILTSPEALKPVYELHLQLPSAFSFQWQPGDSFGVIAPNSFALACTIAYVLLGEKGIKYDSKIGWTSMGLSIHYTPKSTPSTSYPYPFPFPLTSSLTTKEENDTSSQSNLNFNWNLVDLLRTQFDLRTFPKKTFLYALSQFTSNQHAKEVLMFLCSAQGQSSYRYVASKYTLLHLLLSVPFNLTSTSTKKSDSSTGSMDLFLSTVCSLLSPLSPRYYSHTLASNAIKLNEKDSNLRMGCIFNVIKLNVPGMNTPMLGQCTQFLSQLSLNSPLLVFPHPTKVFQLPPFLKKETAKEGVFSSISSPPPIILVGTGTGIAPFLSFLHHLDQEHNHPHKKKESTSSSSSSSPPHYSIALYQGCRHSRWDALHSSTFQTYLDSGLLTKYTITYSREVKEKEKEKDNQVNPPLQYVQDALLKDQAFIFDCIYHQKGMIYVCGDVHKMGKPFQSFLNTLFEPLTKEKEYTKVLIKEGRYRQELW